MSQRAVDINVSTPSDDDQQRNAGAEAQGSARQNEIPSERKPLSI